MGSGIWKDGNISGDNADMKKYEENKKYLVFCSDQRNTDNFAVGVTRGQHIHNNDPKFIEVYMDQYLFLIDDGIVEIMSEYTNDPKEDENSMWLVGVSDIIILPKNYKRRCLIHLFNH